ncbi:hypothetical protein PGT21_005094 [Puccinia graminis f. sp. tritici]|uniref:Uncharacterized protein n=1 Tax=Puccinia graminis f. sp. tritici TaxID=56615 RepID=A0A5B0QYU8_PUCGR|nr:hypothetical protein PGT21_005094 [Puccinia graminis f. sp. tritici]KAA1118360.1 hypothetical protein PGTUg99_006243 [Puccinia graminis f. sp. tritici]
MILPASYHQMIVLLSVCWQGTQSKPLNELTQAGHVPNHEPVGATLNTLAVNPQGYVASFEEKESPEQCIINILNPFKNTRWEKKRAARIPESEQERKAAVQSMDEERLALKKYLLRFKESNSCKNHHKKYTKRLEEIQGNLLLPVLHCVAELKGEEFTLSTPSITNYLTKPKTLRETGKEWIPGTQDMDIFQLGSDSDYAQNSIPLGITKQSSKNSHSQPLSKDSNIEFYLERWYKGDLQEEIKDSILRGDSVERIMDKLGKSLVEELLVLMSESRNDKDEPPNEKLPIHILSCEVINFMYRNHLISQQDYVSLFQEEALREVAENMIHNSVGSYWHPRFTVLGDGKQIFNGWHGSQARDIYEVLEPKQKRMFNFILVGVVFRRYFGFKDSTKIQSMKGSMEEIHEAIFNGNKLFNELETSNSQSQDNQSIQYLQTILKYLIENFEKIESIDDPNQIYHYELSAIFQALRFIGDNYPVFMQAISKRYPSFWKKYLLMYESRQFQAELEKINTYVHIHFSAIEKHPLIVQFLRRTNKNMPRHEELYYISKHFQTIVSNHKEHIDHDGRQNSRYYEAKRIQQGIEELERDIRFEERFIKKWNISSKNPYQYLKAFFLCLLVHMGITP